MCGRKRCFSSATNAVYLRMRMEVVVNDLIDVESASLSDFLSSN